MRPYDAKHDKTIKLRRDNYDADGAWILTDGYQVSLAAQKVGENPTQKISLDRETFNKLIAWYMREQKPIALNHEPPKSEARMNDNDILDSDIVRPLHTKIAELHEKLADMTARYEQEKAIVARIWVLLGSPTYEQLAGRSIYDLIQELSLRPKHGEDRSWLDVQSAPYDPAKDPTKMGGNGGY